MIIYGMGYFNRRNQSLIRSGCPQCGTYGYMRSYDSTRFATLYFIPVLPLGSQKVMAECPKCKQALGMSARKWRKLRNRELKTETDAFLAAPQDRQKAEAALALCVHLQSRPELRRIAPAIEEHHAADADLQAMLAGAYSYLCMDVEAGNAYLRALQLDSTPEIEAESERHMQAANLTRPKPRNRFLQSIPVMIVPTAVIFFLTGIITSALVVNVSSVMVTS